MDLYSAYAGSAPAEVTFPGTVTGAARFFFGTRTRCEHETFGVQTPAGPVQVIDNTGIAPRVPVQPGDQIQVRGEMVHDPGRIPVVHWTHHDPQGKHAGGFIELRGRFYA
jgi:hypothetical protein